MFKTSKDPRLIIGRGQSLSDPRHNIEIAVPDSHRNGHLWCFGTTRVGKTRVMENMAEQDIRKSYSVVIIDPKGDVELFSKVVQAAFEEGRQEELMLVTPIFPAYSAIIDPLGYYFMPEELVGHIVSGVEVGKEKFFYNVAYEISLIVVEALVLLDKNEGKPPLFNLNDVKNRISRTELEKLKAEVDSIDSDEARQLSSDMQKILDSPPDYYGKVSSSLRVALMELTSGNIGKIIGKADENRFLKRLEEGKRVIMIVQLGSLITRKAAFTVGKVVISMIQSFVGRVFASGRKVTPPLCLYIDEAQNVFYYGIDDLFAKAGGAGVWVHGFCQSVSQLHAALGEDYGNVILDNTNTKLFMRVPDAETAQYVADHFGEKSKYAPILSVGGGMTVRQVEEPVIKPQDVLNLPARKFYMMGYSGAFVGKTAEVSDLYVHVKLPNISADEGMMGASMGPADD
ncbi:MAG: TraM recognition domain-containing protein [Desulfobacteraceae bacterium]|nr:TraM recognition domain-containing protein [Desulfobacteraceae bacterium]